MIRFGQISLPAITLGLALGVMSLAGCKQGVGDRCQLTSDCQDGLICVLPVGGTVQSGGVCQDNGGLDMTVNNDFANPPDLTVTQDLATDDAGHTADMAIHVDMSTVD